MWLGENILSPEQIHYHWATAQFPKHFYFAVLRIQTKASCMLGKCSIAELNPLIKAHFAENILWIRFCFSTAVIKPRALHMLGRSSFIDLCSHWSIFIFNSLIACVVCSLSERLIQDCKDSHSYVLLMMIVLVLVFISLTHFELMWWLTLHTQSKLLGEPDEN